MKLKDHVSVYQRIESFYHRLFDAAPSEESVPSLEEEQWVATPVANIRLTEKGYDLEIDMPGFDKEEIEVHFSRGKLTIKAVKKELIEYN